MDRTDTIARAWTLTTGYPLKLVEPEDPRACGPCTLCCKVLHVRDDGFDKPAGRWCEHARKGKGCGIYDTRPGTCADYQCAWLAGKAPSWARPDRIHGLLDFTTDGEGIVLHEDPGYRGEARNLLNTFFKKLAKEGVLVVVVCGDQRTVMGSQQVIDDRLKAAGLDRRDPRFKVSHEG